MTYDWSKVRPEVWTRTLAALDVYAPNQGIWVRCAEGIELSSCLEMARAEARIVRRTRAEVDAEIAKLTRECVENEWAGREDDYGRWERVTALCREPVATEAEPSFYDAIDADPPERDPERCSCEEALALELEKKLESIRGRVRLWQRRALVFPAGTSTNVALEECARELESDLDRIV